MEIEYGREYLCRCLGTNNNIFTVKLTKETKTCYLLNATWRIEKHKFYDDYILIEDITDEKQ